MIILIFDLFIAGGDTTGNSIGQLQILIKLLKLVLFCAETFLTKIFYRLKGFVLLYLIHHPDVQRKMQEELDSVCGSSMPTLAQRPRFVS